MGPRGLWIIKVDRIWLWVYYNKIPIHPIFYLLKGDCKLATLNAKQTLNPPEFAIILLMLKWGKRKGCI